MRVIRLFDVLLQYFFILAFAASLVAGVFVWQFFIVAAAALLCYIVWGVWRLRCPWCRGPVELNDLLRGRKKTCHCPACGHEITVVWRQNLRPAGPRAAAPADSAAPAAPEPDYAPAPEDLFGPEDPEDAPDAPEDTFDAPEDAPDTPDTPETAPDSPEEAPEPPEPTPEPPAEAPADADTAPEHETEAQNPENNEKTEGSM